MSWFESLVKRAAAIDPSISTDAACNELIQFVPESFALTELRDRLEGAASAIKSSPENTKKTCQQLLVAFSCLRCSDRISEASADAAAIQGLAQSISSLIAPVVPQDKYTGKDDDDIPAVFNDDLKKARRQRINHCRAVSNIGLRTVEELTKMNGSVRLDDEVLLTLLAFTDDPQDWAAPEAAAIATALLAQQFSTSGPSREQFITETILPSYLRPLFSRSKPSSITASGRKAEYADSSASRGESIPDDSAQTKPWKYTDLRAVPVVAWAVGQADDQLIAKHWPLFIPVLLTLADDSTTPIRRRGLLVLADFLAKFPDKTLHDTGLAQVFEDAVFPTLAFLPSLTPDDESVQLLVPAYAALLRLADKQPAVGKDGVPGRPKNALLDKMLREGVFTAYFHAKEHVRIVEVLCQQTTAILNQMGIHAVKHLKDLTPMLSAIMADPFAPMSPSTLLSAVKALQAVLANCWPRIPRSPWQDEIINALVLCWLHLAEHISPPKDTAEAMTLHGRIKQELLVSAKALAAVLKTGEVDLASHVAPLVAKEPALAGLFPTE
ncbi:hypothetical protein VTK26DRAFT_7422 [Humicola hyalothermophila]